MREPIQIGTLTFKTKKEALVHFKKILNSYDFGKTLNTNDFNEVYELLKTHEKAKANLRVVKKSRNLGRSYQAKTSKQKKDLTIK